ncbi:MAG: hypothetical protein L0H93_23380, partial [Nocardioides sp.]|nr:hypothetical protein [Nocardioides sp.]
MSKVRVATLLGVMMLGIFLIVFPLATGMFAKVQGVERLTNSLRPSFETAALEQTRTDLDTMQAMSDQLQTETLPALPGALGMTPGQFQSYMAQSFPDVSSGISQLDTIMPSFQGLVGDLEAQQSNFHRADQVPTGFLPSTLLPYFFVIPGVLLFVTGMAGLIVGGRGGAGWSSAALGLSLVFGIVFVVSPFVLSVPAKAQVVDDLQTAFGSVFTNEGAASVRADMATVQDMADQLQSETLPALATGLGMSATQFQGFMSTNFPAVAAGVAQLDTALPGFQALTR